MKVEVDVDVDVDVDVKSRKDTLYFSTRVQSKHKKNHQYRYLAIQPERLECNFLGTPHETSAHANARFQLLPEAKGQPHDPSLPFL
jgi:hypothetical protein